MNKERMIIVVNFTNKEDYEYVKNQPNASHYIRNLVAKDRKGLTELDRKIEDIKRYVDKKLNQSQDTLEKDNLKMAIQNFGIGRS